MTEEQRDDLIIELTLYSPAQIRKMVREYNQLPICNNSDFPFYEFLKGKLEIEGYWKKAGLA